MWKSNFHVVREGAEERRGGGITFSVKPDKAYRRYAAGIYRALSLFDTALEGWADYISFLGRLLKALQFHPPGVSDVPHKALVARRLSQCLNPPLGPGVHQKALEVYGYIFSLIGRDGLGRDLPHYLPGLSPVLAFASLSVKHPLLALFDTFIVALDPTALRPALKAIILASLPGLEEESSEEFERTLDILSGLKNAIGGNTNEEQEARDVTGYQFFWQCMFLAAITSPSRRLGALAYLQRNLPRLGPAKSSSKKPNGKTGGYESCPSCHLEAVTSPEPGLLIRCFAAGLGDDQLLVQRGFLDLLVTNLPLDSDVLHQRVAPEDLIKLATAAASVVSRRDMSLNRRLWTWFLGPEASDSNQNTGQTSVENMSGHDQTRKRQTKYFRRYGLQPLVQGILKMFMTDTSTSTEQARPFRICLALMDRWEIGGLVVPEVFLPAMKSVWRYEHSASTAQELEEVLRSARVFFDGVESGLIWDEISIKLLQATDMDVSNPDPFAQSLDLAFFIVRNFNIQEEEMLLEHIPRLVLSLLLKVQALTPRSENPTQPENLSLTNRLLGLVGELLELVPSRAFNALDPRKVVLWDYSKSDFGGESKRFLADMREHYKTHGGHSLRAESKIDSNTIANLLILTALQMVMREMSVVSSGRSLEARIAILDKLFRRVPAASRLDVTAILPNIQEASENLAAAGGDYVRLKGVVSLLSLLDTLHLAVPSTPWLTDHRMRLILPNLVTALWPHLSPANPNSNVEAVRCVWKIHQLSIDKKLAESCISSLMVQSAPNEERDVLDVEGARRFAILWSHSNLNPTTQARRLSLVPGTPKIGPATSSTEGERLLSRPLSLLLDTLNEPKSELYVFTAGWLQSSANVQIITDFLQKHIEDILCLRYAQTGSSKSATAEDVGCDLAECLYYMQSLLNLILCTPRDIWPLLLNQVIGKERNEETSDPRSLSQGHNEESSSKSAAMSVQFCLTRICLKASGGEFGTTHKASPGVSQLQQTATTLLQEIILRSKSISDIHNELESGIIDTLAWSVRKPDLPLQVSGIGLTSVWLTRRIREKSLVLNGNRRRILSGDHGSRTSGSTERLDQESPSATQAIPPPALFDILLEGLGATGSRPVLHHWIRFLDYCLPLYSTSIYQILLPLVGRFAKSVETLFTDIQSCFEHQGTRSATPLEPVNTVVELLNGLEQTLARAHDRLVEEQLTESNTKTPEPTQGFFGNMVSGVFPSDASMPRSTTANNRLTVILCFKDAIRLCLRLWSWDADNLRRDPTTSSSFSYVSSRLKNRARRILEHLFAAESLECLETLIGSWLLTEGPSTHSIPAPTVLNILHVLDGSRPRNTIPAIFNALYSRTNPSALDPERKSTLTTEMSDTDLARFLVEYTRSVEDDAMDEIWNDCMTFLKDVLANPLPHRQSLPRLLEFTAMLGFKVDNTGFGENRRRRRELSDLFLRQLTATFTVKPLGFSLESPPSRSQQLANGTSRESHDGSAADEITHVLASLLRTLSKILVDSDRITTASTIISTQVVIPTLRWKSFPQNVTFTFLDIFLSLSRIAEASKVWRKDVGEAFNDSRFFCRYTGELATTGWLPLLRQWVISDKGRMTELLSRIPSPTSAGIVFGVGASSARLEADRRTQLNLRRVATLLLAAAADSFIESAGTIQEKLSDLLSATAASSPSAATRAEIYMVLRALVLQTSPIHLASIWPLITTELQDAISSLYPGRDRDRYNMLCIVHACKLLDLLVVTASDDFQLRQWLFITDSIDAVYRAQGLEPHALVDDLAEELDADAGTSQDATISTPSTSQTGLRKPLLSAKVLQDIPKDQLLDRAVRPFLRQLSINAFEGTYSMTPFDRQAAFDDLLFDIFDDKNLV
ncbi:hypothetical protein Q9189_007719 [Teloschistes chrysophthalmus]